MVSQMTKKITKQVASSNYSIEELSLTRKEKLYYNYRFKLMYEQADSDPVLEPTIKNIILNDVTISRLQTKVNSELSLPKPDYGSVDRVQRVINSIQEKNLSLLDSLNLTKAKKDSLNKSPESTPSRLVAGFAAAVATMSPQEREKNKRDIEEAMDRLRNNTQQLLDLIPAEVGDSEIELD